MSNIIAQSYARLVKAGRRTVKDIPPKMVDAVKAIAPELFEEEAR